MHVGIADIWRSIIVIVIVIVIVIFKENDNLREN